MHWNGVLWEADTKREVLELARAVCRDASRKKYALNHKRRLARETTMKAAAAIASTFQPNVKSILEFDNDPFLLNSPAGIVDLKSGVQMPHDRSKLMTRITGSAPEGKAPRWERFIDQFTLGEKPLARYLQCYAGMGLVGVQLEHAWQLLYGPLGGNGKTVYQNLLLAATGTYGKSAGMEVFLVPRGERHLAHIAQFCGVRLDRDKLSQLSEVIPDLMPSELTIAVDILLQQEAMNKTVADWLINLTRQAEALVDVVGKGLRLRELLTIIAEDPGY